MEKTCREGGVDAREESETRGGKIRGTKKKRKKKKGRERRDESQGLILARRMRL